MSVRAATAEVRVEIEPIQCAMTYSWSRRLIKIATDSRIRANLDRMPNVRSTLHEITLLNKGEFALAMARQIINLAYTRQDIRDFVRSQRGSRAKRT